MGKIKKILENNLIGGNSDIEVYPVTSTSAVYDSNNENLDVIVPKVRLETAIRKKAVFGKNLFNKNGTIITGKYLSYSNGVYSILSNSEYCISDYTPVEENTQYISSNIYNGGAVSVIYDSNLNPIQAFKSEEGAITIPEGGKWIRFSLPITSLGVAQFEKGATKTQYEEFTYDNDLNNLHLLMDSRYSVKLWNLEKSKIIGTNGTINSQEENWAVTDYVSFDRTKGLTFKLSTSKNQYISCLAIYDINKEVLKVFSNIGDSNLEYSFNPEDIPEDSIYFRATIDLSKDISNDYIIYKSIESGTINENLKSLENNVNNLEESYTLNLVSKFINLFNYSDSEYKENYFINNGGKETTNEYSSAYAITGYIRLPAKFDCISINYEVGNVYAALYDINKKVLSVSGELRAGNRKIDYVKNAAFVRFSLLKSKKNSTIISIGLIDTSTPYIPYNTIYKFDDESTEFIKEMIKSQIGQSITVDTPKYDNAHIDSLSDGQEIELTNIPDNKNYYGVGASFNIETMGTVKLFKSQNDYCRGEIDIDATNITEYKNGGATNVIPHGLTITDSLTVSIIKKTSTTTITLTNTLGEKVSKELPNWVGCKGGLIKFIAVSGTYTNITLTHSGTWMSKDTWIFGDSYTDYWPSKCYANNVTNFYLDGYSGRNAQGGYDSLLLALKYGKPKRIVWMLGMNNPDTESAVNESWNTIFEQLKELCENNNIQLIPCTIPNVPERINTFKNTIIRDSGLPYIDIASAVGANDKGSQWYDNLLGSDQVHPTGEGSEVIAGALLSGVPDIGI